MFATIKTITLLDETSWKDKVFITLDIDWCHDNILNDSIDLLEKYDVSATWFVTHDTPILYRLRENSNFELGIHPNFNFLLQGDIRNGRNSEEVVDRLMELVPDATSVRSHSMLQSSELFELFAQKGLTHECNHFIPAQSGINLEPWQLWNSMIKIPYFWEDDVACLYGDETAMSVLVQRSGIRVFDFHPIHVFLNTAHLETYEQTRGIHRVPEQLIKKRSPNSIGSREKFIDLLKAKP
jgi:hypothetical protein